MVNDCEFLIRDKVDKVNFYLFSYEEKDEKQVDKTHKALSIHPEIIENDKIILTLFDYDQINGTMFKYRNKDEDKEYVFGFDFQYYKSLQSNTKDKDENSGAYAFSTKYQESFKYSKL